MTFIIDAHEDMALNMLTYGRDYRRPVAETRRLEAGTRTPQVNGDALLGWPEYQQGQVALIFATVFAAHRRYLTGDWENQHYTTFDQARKLYFGQLDVYKRLCGEYPQHFSLVRNQRELAETLQPWILAPAQPPQITHPVGLVMLMEGAEGIVNPSELEEYWQAGLRIIGPSWAGGRLCGGMHEPGGLTAAGRQMLDVMQELGYVLDISHMTEIGARQALEHYHGVVIASHANARAVLKGASNERHLSDAVLRALLERGGVVGMVPFNRFLRLEWQNGDDRNLVSLEMLLAHIDHICQMAGNAEHVGIGTDFDGGFGWPAVPLEVNSIADLQKLVPLLAAHGYSTEDINRIMGGNWQAMLQRALPA